MMAICMRGLCIISTGFVLMAAGAVLAQGEEIPDAAHVLIQPSQSTHLRFRQEKHLQGMPRPLVSRGYLELSSASLLWVTEQPVEQKIQISEQGVQEFSGQQYQQVEGTKLIGQLLLALLNRDLDYLEQYFSLSAKENCVALTPLAKPLATLYSQIEVCGEAQIEQVKLYEEGGNTTDIRLQAVEG